MRITLRRSLPDLVPKKVLEVLVDEGVDVGVYHEGDEEEIYTANKVILGHENLIRLQFHE